MCACFFPFFGQHPSSAYKFKKLLFDRALALHVFRAYAVLRGPCFPETPHWTIRVAGGQYQISLPGNLKYHSHGPWNVLDLCGFIHFGVNFGAPFFREFMVREMGVLNLCCIVWRFLTSQRAEVWKVDNDPTQLFHRLYHWTYIFFVTNVYCLVIKVW